MLFFAGDHILTLYTRFFQALEGEIVSHEPLIDYVASEAQHMITTKHFAAQDIQKQLDVLHNNLLRLKELASGRKIKLQNSLEVQKVRYPRPALPKKCCSLSHDTI